MPMIIEEMGFERLPDSTVYDGGQYWNIWERADVRVFVPSEGKWVVKRFRRLPEKDSSGRFFHRAAEDRWEVSEDDVPSFLRCLLELPANMEDHLEPIKQGLRAMNAARKARHKEISNETDKMKVMY